MRETIRRSPLARMIFELNPPALKRAGASAAELSAVLETLGLHHLTEVVSGAEVSLTGASRSRATVNVLATGLRRRRPRPLGRRTHLNPRR